MGASIRSYRAGSTLKGKSYRPCCCTVPHGTLRRKILTPAPLATIAARTTSAVGDVAGSGSLPLGLGSASQALLPRTESWLNWGRASRMASRRRRVSHTKWLHSDDHYRPTRAGPWQDAGPRGAQRDVLLAAGSRFWPGGLVIQSGTSH